MSKSPLVAGQRAYSVGPCKWSHRGQAQRAAADTSRMTTAPLPPISLRPVALRDGTTVSVRPLQRRDRAAILRFLKGLSPRSTYMRFCCGGTDLAKVAQDFIDLGPHRQGVVAFGAHGEIVGHAEYIVISANTAEVAIVVADAVQGVGLATRLIEHLAELGRANGLSRFVAEVLPGNEAMLAVFSRGCGAAVFDSEHGHSVEFGIGATVPLALTA